MEFSGEPSTSGAAAENSKESVETSSGVVDLGGPSTTGAPGDSVGGPSSFPEPTSSSEETLEAHEIADLFERWHGPKTLTRHDLVVVDKDSPLEPYLSFTVGPELLRRVVIEIWSHDQGFCSAEDMTEDPYENSHTYFALGILHDDSQLRPDDTNDDLNLCEIQRNVRASPSMVCHTLDWSLNVPFDGEYDEAQGWLESISASPGTKIGIFPIVEHPGCENHVYDMTLKIYDVTTVELGRIELKKSTPTDTLAKGKAKETESILHDEQQTGHNMGLAVYFFKTAASLGQRAEKSGLMADLLKAEEAAVLSIGALPDDHPGMAMHLSLLAKIRFEQFRLSRLIDHLSAAISIVEQAIATRPQKEPLCMCLDELQEYYRARWQQTGSMQDIDKAVEASEKLLREVTYDLSVVSNRTVTLASHFMERSGAAGSLDDLAKAINVLDETLQFITNGEPGFSRCANKLAICLGLRYGPLASINDLARAVDLAEQAIATVEADKDLPHFLNTLANLLRNRYNRTNSIDDLKRAVAMAQRAVLLTTPEAVEHSIFSHTLSHSLSDTYLENQDSSTLETAIQAAGQAAETAHESDPHRSLYLNSHAKLLGLWYRNHSNSESDISLAIQKAEESVAAVSMDDPKIAGLLGNLGRLYEIRFEQTNSGEDRDAGLSALLKGWQSHNAPPSIRLQMASLASVIYAEQQDWKSGSELLREAVFLLPRVGSRALQDTDIHFTLKKLTQMASDAAAMALQAGQDASDILPILELGRAVTAGLLIDMRQDVSDLHSVHPSMAKKFLALRDELNAPQQDLGNLLESTISSQNRRHQASNEFEDLIQDIRAKPGFHEFLLPPSAESLVAAAKDHPIVVVNSSIYRHDAFLVETSGIRVLKLPDLTASDIGKHVLSIRDARKNPRPLLKWLWDVLCRPCLDALGFSGPASDDKLPHVWWIPTGLLNQLPLHAAGIYTQGSKETVLDRVVSSYASSIKALQHGRQHRPNYGAEMDAKNSAVLVAMKDTPGQRSLKYAEEEVTVLQALCTSLNLEGVIPQRCKADVLGYLKNCKVLHFAGHGESKTDPSSSLILLEDWKESPLTVADLRDHWVQDDPPFLAYLSACSTGANQSLHLSNEVVHLVSSFQLVGFRNVIGTLWEVSDQYCVDVARVLYETLRDEGMTDEAVSRGLHKALRKLRDGVIGDGFKRATTEDVEGEEEVSSGEEWTEEKTENDQERIAKRKDQQSGSGMNTYWIPYIHFGA